MTDEKIIQKIKEQQEVGKNVIDKMTTRFDAFNVNALQWLNWNKISVQEQTDQEIILRNDSIDYSKVTNPQYGRFSIPRRVTTMSNRDFAKYIRLVIKTSRNKHKIVHSLNSEERIKRYKLLLDYEFNLLINRDKNKVAAREFKNLLDKEFSDFAELRSDGFF